MRKILYLFPMWFILMLYSFRESAYSLKISLLKKNIIFRKFYLLFNSNISNEYDAVLSGIIFYYDSLKRTGYSFALLRRNIHRIEKGLIMRPRRAIFAEQFIQETVSCYLNAINSKKIDPTESKWAQDVLDKYFQSVSDSPIVDKAKELYLALRVENDVSSNSLGSYLQGEKYFQPYSYHQLPSLGIDFEELNNLFIRRRSVRWYQTKTVPFDLIQKAVNISALAPSACNRQSFRFLYSSNRDKVIRVAECAGGTSGFAKNLQSIMCVVGDLSAYPNEVDRHLIYIDSSLAVMQLMLALETLGLSSCSINWPEIPSNEIKIRQIINLKDYERVIMLIAIGYADEDGGVAYSQKKKDKNILEDIS